MRRRNASRGRAPANQNKTHTITIGLPDPLRLLKNLFSPGEYSNRIDDSTAQWFVLGLPLSALFMLFFTMPLFRHPPPWSPLKKLADDRWTVGKSGVVAMCFLVAAICNTMQILHAETKLLNVFLAICTFTAAIHFGITGYLLGLWDPGQFYLGSQRNSTLSSFNPEHGEKYFASAFGVACLGWDGVTHLMLQGFVQFCPTEFSARFKAANYLGPQP